MLSDMDTLPSIKLGNFILRFEIDEATPEVLEIARKELRENPDVSREAVKELRDLLKGKYILSRFILFPTRSG